MVFRRIVIDMVDDTSKPFAVSTMVSGQPVTYCAAMSALLNDTGVKDLSVDVVLLWNIGISLVMVWHLGIQLNIDDLDSRQERLGLVFVHILIDTAIRHLKHVESEMAYVTSTLVTFLEGSNDFKTCSWRGEWLKRTQASAKQKSQS